MLEHLNIKNLVVVEELNIQFKFGMTVITGETGAGKSILVQALNIVSGGIEIQVAEENVEKANELINAEPQLSNQGDSTS